MKTVDPVCKMVLEDKGAAATSSYKGTTYYFCSKACKKKCDEDPEVYVKAGTVSLKAGVLEEGTDHTCPMHPEIRKKGPGVCPKCGMALEPMGPSIPVSQDRVDLSDAS